MELGRRKNIDRFNPYIIAEIGVNHEGSVKKAKELIQLAKEGGADAAKFQTYKAEKLASKFSPSYWDTNLEPIESQFELFKKFDSFNPDDYFELADFCRRCDIDFLSTPFDNSSIDFLDELMPFYKVASADLTNIPLLRKISEKGKTIILSTGASEIYEIVDAISIIESVADVDIAIMHCILSYPTTDKDANLLMIKILKSFFPERCVGYSDHTLPLNGMLTLSVASLFGAEIIEKHFTDDKSKSGNDHYHAMDKNDLLNFKKNLTNIREIVGNALTRKPINAEILSRQNARRSIVLNRKINAGEILTQDNLICKRPGTGISPKFWDEILGKKIKVTRNEDELLQWSDIDLD